MISSVSKVMSSDAKPTRSYSEINSVLDYGAGKSDWNAKGFDNKSNQSAKEYFNLSLNCNFIGCQPTLDITLLV